MIRKICLFLVVFSLFLCPVFADVSEVFASPSAVQFPDQMIGTSVMATTQLRSVTPQQTNGFKALMLTFLGNYDTVVTDYTYQNTSGYYTHVVDVECDFAWICSSGILAILLFCTFRFLGGLVCRQ